MAEEVNILVNVEITLVNWKKCKGKCLELAVKNWDLKINYITIFDIEQIT